MDWQQKLQALQSLCEISLKMRRPGDWYVLPSSRQIGGDGLLCGECGNGATPEAAVEDDWRLLVETLPREKYIVLSGYPYGYDNRRNVRWNGFMWVDVEVDGK